MQLTRGWQAGAQETALSGLSLPFPRFLLICAALLTLPATVAAQCTPAFTIQRVWTQDSGGTAKTTFSSGETIQFAVQISNLYGGSGETSVNVVTSFFNNSKTVNFPLGVSTWTWDASAPTTPGGYDLTVNVLDKFCGMYVPGKAGFIVQAKQNPGGTGQNLSQLYIAGYGTFVQGSLVYFRLSFANPDNVAVGFGFKGINGFGWAEENHPFSSPSYGLVSPGEVDYPFNELCGTASAYESDVQAWIYGPTADQRSDPVTIHLSCSSDFRNQILNRARSWIRNEPRPYCPAGAPVCSVPYRQDCSLFASGQRQCASSPDGPAPSGGYRTDCSGFVSYAWQIKGSNGQPYSPATRALGSATYTTDLISFDKLKPGDAINNNNDGNFGHVLIFLNWVDQSRTKFVAYDEHWPDGSKQVVRTLVSAGNGFTIGEYDSKDTPGPFHPQRYIISSP